VSAGRKRGSNGYSSARGGAAIAALALSAGVVFAQNHKVPRFAPPEVFDVFVTYPYGIAAADFLDADGQPGQDGFPELAVAGAGWDMLSCGSGEVVGSNVRVLRNTGSWDTDPSNGLVFDWATGINIAIATELAFADVTGKNGLDLVLLAHLPGGPIGVLLVYESLGGGQFDSDPQIWTTTHATLRGLVTVDVDNDGDIDVIAASDDCNFTSEPRDLLVLFENTTTPGGLDFESHDIWLGIAGEVGAGDVALADFFGLQPGQALLDFVTPNPLADSYTIIENLGGLLFNATTVSGPSGCAGPDWHFKTIASGRFGADSYMDFAAVDPDGRYVGVFLGGGTGGFQSHCDNSQLGYQLYAVPNSVRAYDTATARLNGGNNLDLVVSLNNPAPGPTVPWSGAAAVLLGRPDGTFQMPSPDEAYLFELGDSIDGSAKLATVDLNNDGFDDIVVANFYSDNISVLINQMLVATVPGEP